MSTPPLVIAIDGPSGSGKSSTSRGVAQRLGLAHLDTGSMYRAVACRLAHLGVDPAANPHDAIEVARTCHLELDTSANHDRVVIDGEDVTKEIRDPQTSATVSAVATIQPIRDALTARMRQVAAARGRIVMEGRDITTVVCPDAQVRVLLVADPAVRIARRRTELGEKIDMAQVIDSIVRRDRDDATVSTFEEPAEGVTVVDSTHLNLNQVINTVIDLVPVSLR
ncbi:(d)CMP kinase [Propionibacterium sp. NM47_B9-13]|uniref:Cytidylate kinase n=2 Tax=Cutibacterium modestum TaxID=2559073 RepID=A0AAD1KQ87_9ACTN|nr:(d)CMP kinase [Cutibacterium modestum]MCP2376154.1 cytidylate kinase [Cutibacterium modestum 28N]MCP2381280.1 cytidylate kinase [Cutibacterium modestum 30N]TGY29233.1 (d)CMP kinase [Propionibacterium sp. NM47_B9-13]EGG27251.1 cytidylate kinase [Cutibacterium modestum P08]REB74712.1 cytidylate kinase [Cutibacterium modestum]